MNFSYLLLIRVSYHYRYSYLVLLCLILLCSVFISILYDPFKFRINESGRAGETGLVEVK